jgi:formate hydrogenlyase transcriptional activator
MTLAAAAGNQPVNFTSTPRNMRAVLDDTERQQIVAALEQANWTVAGPNGAAAKLGIKRSTLQSRMQRLGIRVSRTGV